MYSSTPCRVQEVRILGMHTERTCKDMANVNLSSQGNIIVSSCFVTGIAGEGFYKFVAVKASP